MLKTILIAVISSCILSLGGMVAYEHFGKQTQSVVTVDLQKLIAAEIEKNAKAGMTPEAQQQRAQQFSQALEKALTLAAEGGKKVVLTAPAVVRGAVDITEQVKAAIEADLGKELGK